MSKIRIEDSFIILLAVVCWLDTDGSLWIFFAAAAIHEMGHWLMLRILGGRVQCFRLTAAGGNLKYWLPVPAKWKHALIAAGGPALGFLGTYWAAAQGYYTLAGAGILLNLVNCLPVPPLDGGLLVRAITERRRVEMVLGSLGCLLVGAAGIVLFYKQYGVGLLIFFLFLTISFQKNLQER